MPGNIGEVRHWVFVAGDVMDRITAIEECLKAG
jgi:hypothetical protein